MAKTPTKTLPRAVPLLTGMTAGVFAAFVVEVELGAMHLSAAEALNQLLSGAPLRFASASVLWAVAGTAFVVGAGTAALLGRYPPPWWNFRALRWIIGALITLGLGHVAHGAATPHDVGPGMVAIANIAVSCVAAVMALLGASFARQR